MKLGSVPWDDVFFSVAYGFDVEYFIFKFSKSFSLFSFSLLKRPTLALIKRMNAQLAQALDFIFSIPWQWMYLNADMKDPLEYKK